MRGKHVRGNADIGDRTDPAHGVEAQQAKQGRAAAQLPVAIGEEVVDPEVGGHGEDSRRRLRPFERHAGKDETEAQRGEVNDDADRAYGDEKKETRRHEPARTAMQ